MRTLCLVLFVSFGVVACEKKEGAKDSHDHAVHGPNGGDLAELGDHAAHLEVKQDEKGSQWVVYVLDADLKPMAPDAAPILNLKTDDGPKQLTSVATEESHRFTFSDAVLGKHVDGRFRVSVGGVEYAPDVPHHDH